MALDSLTLETAQALLRRFTCLDRLSLNQIPDYASTREALRLVREHSDYQIFGICAESPTQAIAVLHIYLTALDYPQRPQPDVTHEGVTYLKFNPKNGRCHCDRYIGNHRGVLVSCQSAYDGDVNETFGHLPLNLFKE